MLSEISYIERQKSPDLTHGNKGQRSKDHGGYADAGGPSQAAW